MSEFLLFIDSIVWVYCLIIWLISLIISGFVYDKYRNNSELCIFIICLVLFWYSSSLIFISLFFLWLALDFSPIYWILWFAILTFCIIISYYKSYGLYFGYSNWAYISGDWRKYVWGWKNWNAHWKWIMYLQDWSYFEGLYKNWIQCVWKFYDSNSKMFYEWNFEYDQNFMKALDKYKVDMKLLYDNFSRKRTSPVKKSSFLNFFYFPESSIVSKSFLKKSIKNYNDMLDKTDDNMIVEQWIIKFFIHINESLLDFSEKNSKSDDFKFNFFNKYVELNDDFLSSFSTVLKENNIDINDLSDYSFGGFYNHFSKLADYFHESLNVFEWISAYTKKQSLLAVLYVNNKNIFNEMCDEYKTLLDRLNDFESRYPWIEDNGNFEKEFWEHHLKYNN